MSQAARRLQTAVSLARAIGRSALHPEVPPPATFPLAPGDAARITIRWPEHYEWPAAGRWVDRLRAALARQVTLVKAPIAQIHEGVVTLEVLLDGASHPVAIDYSDYDRVLDRVAATHTLVFKMQYRNEGYREEHVLAGGYVPRSGYLPALLPGLRHLREHSPPQLTVYGRFGAAYAPGVRGAATQALREQDDFPYEGDLVLRSYPDYLREAALSRICIDLPGNGDLCHRLVEYLALGCCVVRPPALVRFPVALQDGVEIVYAPDAEQGLVQTCAKLLGEPGRTADIGRRARAYYDRHLRAEQLAGWYLQCCLQRLAEQGRN